jgi:hypothetical protein
MSLVNVYKTRVNNSRYVFSNGTVATFRGDTFITEDESEIAQLDNEIRLKHPSIYQEPGQRGIDPKTLDPMEIFKEKIIAEYLAKVAAANNPLNDRGNSVAQNPQAGISNSSGIASVALGAGPSTFQLPQVPQTPVAQPSAAGIPSSLANALNLLQVPADVVPVQTGSIDVAPQGDGSAAKAFSLFTPQGGATGGQVMFPIGAPGQ